MSQSPMDRHECDALVLSCMDFRFIEHILPTVQKTTSITSQDLVVLAGGAKNIANPSKPEYKIAGLDNIGISARLHRIQKIILLVHDDCGAYGGSKAFESKEKEHETYKEDLMNATKEMTELYPDKQVHGFLVAYEGNQVTLQEVK